MNKAKSKIKTVEQIDREKLDKKFSEKKTIN